MRKLFGPPRGPDVRRLVAFMALAIGIPRLSVFGSLISRFLMPDFLPAQFYGMALTIFGALLLATVGKRLTWYGRLVAVLAFGAHVTMGVDAFSASTVSTLIEFLIAYALWGEITAHD